MRRQVRREGGKKRGSGAGGEARCSSTWSFHRDKEVGTEASRSGFNSAASQRRNSCRERQRVAGRRCGKENGAARSWGRKGGKRGNLGVQQDRAARDRLRGHPLRRGDPGGQEHLSLRRLCRWGGRGAGEQDYSATANPPPAPGRAGSPARRSRQRRWVPGPGRAAGRGAGRTAGSVLAKLLVELVLVGEAGARCRGGHVRAAGGSASLGHGAGRRGQAGRARCSAAFLLARRGGAGSPGARLGAPRSAVHSHRSPGRGRRLSLASTARTGSETPRAGPLPPPAPARRGVWPPGALPGRPQRRRPPGAAAGARPLPRPRARSGHCSERTRPAPRAGGLRRARPLPTRSAGGREQTPAGDTESVSLNSPCEGRRASRGRISFLRAAGGEGGGSRRRHPPPGARQRG